MNCHRDIEVSKDKPAMIVECWFDEKHPTGRPDNYDPYMKQMKEVSTLYDLKERITTTFNSKKKLKIFLEKPVDYHRMPWVWLCSAKVCRYSFFFFYRPLFRSKENQSGKKLKGSGSSEPMAILFLLAMMSAVTRRHLMLILTDTALFRDIVVFRYLLTSKVIIS